MGQTVQVKLIWLKLGSNYKKRLKEEKIKMCKSSGLETTFNSMLDIQLY
jgi:hypothetical protein